jgi:transitional endoplasmic reticulum ATPase
VGTVRVLLDTEAMVDIDGRLRTISRDAGLELDVGNVVEGNDTDGILRVLADRPLPRVEIALGELFDVTRMREQPGGTPSYDDFGGYEAIKDKAKELVEFPLTYHEQLVRIGARPIKGVLFTGDSGTGKTLLGRIIADRAQAAFYKISGPEIVSKWVGSSEEVLREIFADAKANQPSIIFFDEIEIRHHQAAAGPG